MKRASWAATALIGLLAVMAGRSAGERPGNAASRERPFTISLQPLGPVPQDLLRRLSAGLRTTFSADVVTLPSRDLPQVAWYEPRRRWRGDVLIDRLDEPLPGTDDRRVAVTASDISTTKPPHPDWGVFGLCRIGGRTAVVSTFRLRRGASASLVAQRLERVAAHELGHAFGLDHCSRRACLMADAGGSLRSVDEGAGFCEVCRAGLGARLQPAVEAAPAPKARL